MKNGVDKATARERIAVGCHWMCVPGREFPMNDTVKINIAKVLEQAMISLREEGQPSLERLYSLWEEHLGYAAETVAAGVNLHLDHIADVTPELVMNLMFHGSLERGLDASRCAELYTVGCDGAGLATVADSLAAIEVRVEREGLVSWRSCSSCSTATFRTSAYAVLCSRRRAIVRGIHQATTGEAAYRELFADNPCRPYAERTQAYTRLVLVGEDYRIRSRGRRDSERAACRASRSRTARIQSPASAATARSRRSQTESPRYSPDTATPLRCSSNSIRCSVRRRAESM